MRGSHAPRRATHASVPRRPVTISACCPAASAGLPLPTSFRCGGGPSCPHEQGARGQQPGGEQGQQVAAGAGERQGAGAGDRPPAAARRRWSPRRRPGSARGSRGSRRSRCSRSRGPDGVGPPRRSPRWGRGDDPAGADVATDADVHPDVDPGAGVGGAAGAGVEGGVSPARGPTSSSRPARGRDRLAVASALGLVSAAAAARARWAAEAWPDAVVAGRPRRVPIETSAPAARGTRTLARIAPEPSPARAAWTVPPARSVRPSSLDRTRPSAQTRTCAEVGRPSRAVTSAEISWALAAPALRTSRPPPSAATPMARFIHRFTWSSPC